ncbi:transporter substrate-binding domain-containing protein [Pleionea sediminis]|uniref:transporter substrate-binding domain-containing protein n=1 Tax=Pleionea sediminis TaxID=2569479 RepID=UPI001186DF77|nr:transporter substrate-binding domain-containing protein [Pleionea sediminis]
MRCFLVVAVSLVLMPGTLLSSNEPAVTKADQIIIWNRIKEGNEATHQLLLVALKLSKSQFGDYVIRYTDRMEQGRVVRELKNNERVHVALFAPDISREVDLKAIKIPVTKGLLGHRVCLIKKGNEHRFDDVYSLEDWRKRNLTIGQGLHWPDTRVLKHNGISVVTNSLYLPLFNMLEKGRFDCFSRSVNEVLDEYKKHGSDNIVIEPRLLLVYKLPMYFFVSQQNNKLAQRIFFGLKKAKENGEYDKIFNHYYVKDLEPLNLESRVRINLENPFLTDETLELLDLPENKTPE